MTTVRVKRNPSEGEIVIVTTRRIAIMKTTGAERENSTTSLPAQEHQSRAGARLNQMLREAVPGVQVELHGVLETIGCVIATADPETLMIVVAETMETTVALRHLGTLIERTVIVVLPGILIEKIMVAQSFVGTLGVPESLGMIALPGLGRVTTGVLGSRNQEEVVVVGLAGSLMINVHHHEKVRQHREVSENLSTASQIAASNLYFNAGIVLEKMTWT